MNYDELREALESNMPWQTLYPLIAEHVVEVLEEELEDMQTVNTTRLAEMAWPAEWRGPDLHATSRFYRALRALSKHDLSHCVTEGASVKRWGRDVVPLMWHRPDPTRRHVPAPAALRSPEHALVQRVAALDADSLEIDPFAVLPEILALIADARKLAGTPTA